jgi:hypothetical protein
MPAYKNVSVVVVKNSTREISTRSFEHQEFKFDREPDTVEVGVDGDLSIRKHLTHAFWKGGHALDLKNVTNVHILSADGQTLIKGEVKNTYNVPRDTVDGVTFDIW